MNPPLWRQRWFRVLTVLFSAVAVLLVVGLLAADSIVLRQVRVQTEALSREWGRPIEVGGISVTLFSGAGIHVTGIRVGAGPDEELPLLEVAGIRVRVALLRALFSRGREVEVRSVEVNGLRFNVVRLPDRTTNVERLQRRLAESRPPPPEPQRAPSDLSFLKVTRVTLDGARIAFVDRATAGSREIRVDPFNAEVRGLQVGQPLELQVRAAVLSDRPNFEMSLRSAPLPPTLVPVPERLILKVQPIDLAPLAPFMPASLGLQAGRFQAELEVAFGGVVPGGSGPVRIQGTVQAAGLALAGQQGGRPLDVVLDADLDGDATAGNLRIGKLRLDFGPAGLTGRGSATGLTSNSPRIEGLEIVSHDLDPALLADYYPPLRQLATRVSGPVGLSLRASGTQAEPALELRVQLTPVRLAFPQILAKSAGARAEILAHVRGSGAGAIRFDTETDLAGIDLRSGGSINKAPGDRLQIRLAGIRRAAAHEQTVDLSKLELLLPGGDAAAGKGRVVFSGGGEKRKLRFEAELASHRLDLDRLLLTAEKTQETKVEKANEKKLEKKPQRSDPKAFSGLSGTATVRIGLLRVKKANLRDVLIRIRMQEDEVIVEQGRLGAFGGEVTVDGTRVRLAHPEDPFHLTAQGKGIDVGAAVGFFSPQKIVSGRFDGKVDLTGGGETKADLVQSLVGALDGNVSNGAFLGTDLVASIAGPLAKSLPFGAAGQISKGGATALGKALPFAITFKNGVAQLKPIQISEAEATISVGGGFRLDGTLDLAGNVALSPPIITRLTGGRVRPQEPIPVAYRLTGPAWKPVLGNLDLTPAVKIILQQAGAAAFGKALGSPAASPVETKQKAEDEGRRKAEDARKRAEEEAKKKLKGLFR